MKKATFTIKTIYFIFANCVYYPCQKNLKLHKNRVEIVRFGKRSGRRCGDLASDQSGESWHCACAFRGWQPQHEAAVEASSLPAAAASLAAPAGSAGRENGPSGPQRETRMTGLRWPSAYEGVASDRVNRMRKLQTRFLCFAVSWEGVEANKTR